MTSSRTARLVGLAALVLGSSAFAGTTYSTVAASNITATGATLNGSALSTIGLSGEFFDYGLTTKYGNTVQGAPQGVNGPVSANISGLQCATTYHFRFRGDPKPPKTTVQGSDMSFQTSACSGPVNGFSGAFAPANWQAGSNAPVNLVNTNAAPASVTLSNYPVWIVSASSFTYKATVAGTVAFTYNYAYSPDNNSSPAQCQAAWVLNGQTTPLSAGSPNNQQGTKSFTVNAGDNFGFFLGAGAQGCQCHNPNNANLNPSTLTISSFSFTPN